MTKEKRYRTGIAIAAAAIIGVVVVAVGLLVVQGDDSPSGDLSEGVKAGDADVVRAHLDAGADPDEPRVFGLTPLMPRRGPRRRCDRGALDRLRRGPERDRAPRVSPLPMWPLRPTLPRASRLS